MKVMSTLKDTTREVIDTHIQHYNKLKDDIVKINENAENAINQLNFYGSDPSIEPSDNPDNKVGKNRKAKKYQLPKGVEELDVVHEDEEAEVMIAAGGKVSQEAHKKAMFTQFEFMGKSMRDFGINIEQKLDEVYKQGACNKFGFDDVASIASLSEKGNFNRKQTKEDRELNRIEKEATDFLKKVEKMKANQSDFDDAISQKSGMSALSKGTITSKTSKIGQKVSRTGNTALKPRNMTKK